MNARTRVSFAFLFASTIFASTAARAQIDFFGQPNDFFCPQLFGSSGSPEDRLLEAYAQAIAKYRESMDDARFAGALERMLKAENFFRLPLEGTGTHPSAEFVVKFGRALDEKGFREANAIDDQAFRKRVRVTLESALEKARRDIRGTEKSVERTKEARRMIAVFEGHTKRIEGVVFSPDESEVLSVSDDGRMILWDVRSGKEKRVFVGHSSSISTVRTDADFKRALTSSWDGSMILWDLVTGKKLQRFSNRGDPIYQLEVDAAFTRAVTRSETSVASWEIESGAKLKEFETKDGSWMTMQLKPDFTKVFLGSTKGNLFSWDPIAGKILREMKAPNGKQIDLVSLSEDFTRALVAQHTGGVLGVWDVENERLLREFPKFDTFAFNAVRVSPNFKKAVITGHDGLKVFDLEKYTVDFSIPTDGEREFVGTSDDLSLAVSSDHEKNSVGDVVLWNVNTGAQVAHLTGHTDIVRTLRFSKDQTLLVTGGYDSRVIYWDLKSEGF